MMTRNSIQHVESQQQRGAKKKERETLRDSKNRCYFQFCCERKPMSMTFTFVHSSAALTRGVELREKACRSCG